MARPVDLDAQSARRTQILDAVERVIATQGLAGLTMARIIAASKLSAGSVYHHFKGKDDILMGLVLRQESEQQELIDALGAGHALRDILYVSADEMLAYLCDPTKARLLVELAGAARDGAPWAEAIRAQNQLLSDAMIVALGREEAKRWRPSGITPELRSRMIFALWDGLVSQAAEAPLADLAQIKRMYLGAVAGVLKA
ncbi:MAG: TetR/AcrR family transcriptional regulator [Mangrovicoccus sp.]|nr:TetR/AcrR family transcriptional regulator [Mangrovicoccus sp.]